MNSTVYESRDYTRITVVSRTVVKSGSEWRAQDRKITVYVVPDVAPNAVSVDWNAMLLEAEAGLKSMFLDALTSAAEMQKTVSMIVGFRKRILDQVATAIQKFKHARMAQKVKSWSSFFKLFSQFWLEYRFGWRLLYYDYENIRKYLNETRQGLVRRRWTRSKVIQGEPVVLNQNYTHGCYLTVTTTRQQLSQCKAGVIGKCNMSLPGKIDPITTAWEVIPLSLVIDMFWNVGTVLSAWSPFSHVVMEGRYTSLVRLTTSQVTWNATPWVGYQIIDQFSDGPSGYTRETRSRAKLDPVYLPSPLIRVDLGRAVDLAALTVMLKDAALDLIVRNTRV